MNDQPVGIGLVGAGRWGRNYLDTLASLTDCRLVAVTDPRPAAVPPDTVRYASVDEMLDNPMIEAVVLAVPDELHVPLALQVLNAHRHVLIEKPLARSCSDAELVATTARKQQKTVAVAYTPLYHSNFVLMRKFLTAGSGPFQARFRRTSRGRPELTTLDDLLFDLGSHDLALMIALFGEPLELSGKIGCDPSARTVFNWQARFADGSVCSGQLAWSETPVQRRVEIASRVTRQVFDETAVSGVPPLTALCRDFALACQHHHIPLADIELGIAVTRCLAALSCSHCNTPEPAPAAFR